MPRLDPATRDALRQEIAAAIAINLPYGALSHIARRYDVTTTTVYYYAEQQMMQSPEPEAATPCPPHRAGCRPVDLRGESDLFNDVDEAADRLRALHREEMRMRRRALRGDREARRWLQEKYPTLRWRNGSDVVCAGLPA